MADKVYYNPSLGLQSITPAFDDDTFLFFLEAYYDWMQTTDITFNGSDGSFANGEIITGQDSNATATIRYVGSNTITVSMKTDRPFDLGEEIVGSSSANSAFVLELSDNVLRRAARIRENKNNDKAQGQFLEYLKGELNKGIPTKTSSDRRKLIAQLREFFKSKSTEEAYTFLFRALFNETIEIRYPGDDLLRVSDGNFEKLSTIRINERAVVPIAGQANVIAGNNLVIGSNTNFATDFVATNHFKVGDQQAIVSSVVNATHMFATTNFATSANDQFLYELIPTDVFGLKNKTIKGRDSGAVGVVSDIRSSTLGGRSYADVVLRLISGEFIENEIIEDIDDPSANVIAYGVVSSITINDGGTGYAVDDDIIINGDGAEATAKVTSVSDAPISKIIVANTGIGYRNNIEATINNTGTGGTGFRTRVVEIANTYTVGANNQYTVGETATIKIINRGSGYRALPTITLEDTTVSALGLLHEKLIRINNPGTLYEVGDALVFTNPAGFSGNTAVGRVAAVTERWAETPASLVASEPVLPYKDESLLDDFGSNTVTTENEVGILLEGSYYDRVKTEDWRAIGPIERLELSYANGVSAFGTGYTTSSLPTIAVTSANGIGANLEAFNIQGKSAVIEIDSSNNVAGIGSIREITILNQGINYTTANVDATVSGDGNANLTAEISGLFVDAGRFTNDDGKVNYKVLQDSLFYQDFSYVIRSGLSFDRYKDIVKEVVHPAGLEFFGEIVITNTISLASNFTSEVIADRAPRFVSLFSFLSLWEAYGLPPPVQSSIIVKIKSVVSYTDHAKLDLPEQNGGTVKVDIEPIVITAASVIESTDPSLKGPLQFALGPIDVSADFVLSRTKAEKYLEPVFVSTTSSFSPTEYNVEIISFLDMVPVVIPWETMSNVSTPKIIKTVLDVQSNLATTGAIREVDILTLPPPKLRPPYTFGDYYTLADYATATISDWSETRFNDSVYGISSSINEYRLILPPTYVDVTMAFYSNIVTMETDIKSVEIDIELLQNLAIVTNTQYEIDIISGEGISKGVFAYKSLPIVAIAFDSISEYSNVTFNDQSTVTYPNVKARVDSLVELDIAPTKITQPLTVVPSDFFPDIKYIQPQISLAAGDLSELKINIETFADATMAFYSNIVTIETDIKSVEIDVELFKSVSSSFVSTKYKVESIGNLNESATLTSKVVVEILLGDRYKDELISEYASESISKYDDEVIQSKVAIGRAGFVNGKENFLYKDAQLREFWDSTIEDINPHIVDLVDTFNTKYGDDTVRKHVPIGMVDVTLQNFGNVPIFNLSPSTINTYAASTFNDPSGLRPVVVGSNTQFTNDFEIGDYIVIADEKFIVMDIANSEYLEINVSATQNYNNVPAYREIFV